MPDSVWLCPSRGRPENVAELREEWGRFTGDEAELVIAVDDDDPQLAAYQAGGPVRIVHNAGGYGPVLNELAPVYAPHFTAVGCLSDDHRPRTPGWARKLLDALDGRAGVAYGNDGSPRAAQIPTSAVISSPVITALGYMTPPGVIHLWTDVFHGQLGEDLGCLAYCPDVLVEHMHPSFGKAPWDECYARVNAPERYAADGAAYNAFLRGRWPGDLARLKEKLGLQ